MQQVFEAASTRPTEFVLANLAVHVGAPIVFLNQGSAPGAILNQCSRFISKPIMQALLIPRTFPHTMLLKLTLPAQFLLALRALE